MPTVSDKEQIKEDIVQQLYWDSRVDAANVQVAVDKYGEVTLEGTVSSFYAQEAAESNAWIVNGVTAVKNDMAVKYPAVVKAPDDEAIEENINNVILWSTEIDSSDIEVEVRDNIVTLEGSVDSFWKKRRVRELADISGVYGVVDKIAVVPTEDLVDEEVAEEVVSAISRNRNVDAEDVTVEVKKGKVILSGEVANWAAFKAAEESASYTLGVKEVENNINVLA